MTEQIDIGQTYRRRASDRAEQQASRAAQRGDRAGYLLATAKAEAARRRREAWTEPRHEPADGEAFD